MTVLSIHEVTEMWPGLLAVDVLTYGGIRLPHLAGGHIADLTVQARTCLDGAVDYVALAHTCDPAGCAVTHWTAEPDGRVELEHWYWAPSEPAVARGLRYAEQRRRLGLAEEIW